MVRAGCELSIDLHFASYRVNHGRAVGCTHTYLIGLWREVRGCPGFPTIACLESSDACSHPTFVRRDESDPEFLSTPARNQRNFGPVFPAVNCLYDALLQIRRVVILDRRVSHQAIRE